MIDLIDRPNEKPWGAGEPTATAVPFVMEDGLDKNNPQTECREVA